MKTFAESKVFSKDFFWFSAHGEQIEQDFFIIAKHRNSGRLSESNFDVALVRLRPYGAYSFQTSHWAVGWMEWLALPANAPQEGINAAQEIENELADYPVLDEEDYFNRKWNGAITYWETMPLRKRIHWCVEEKESIFAARHDTPPSDVMDRLLESMD